jgi:hypothetical protein
VSLTRFLELVSEGTIRRGRLALKVGGEQVYIEQEDGVRCGAWEIKSIVVFILYFFLILTDQFLVVMDITEWRNSEMHKARFATKC